MKELDELIGSIKHIGYIDVRKENDEEYDLIIKYLIECQQLQQENERLKNDLSLINEEKDLIFIGFNNALTMNKNLLYEKQELIDFIKNDKEVVSQHNAMQKYIGILNKLEGKE